jgi:uroporphyrinogen-III synthase
MDAVRPVVLTRPAGRNTALAGALRDAGLSVIEAPALVIEPLDTPMPPLEPGDLCVFVSRQAVDAGFARRAGASWPDGVHAAAVGAATAQALRTQVPAGLVLAPAADVPPDSESLLAVIDAAGLPPRRAHILRAARGRDWLAGQLQARGWAVECHALYQRHPVVWSAAICDVVAASPACTLLLTSPEAVDAVADSLQRHGRDWPAVLRVVTLHERIVRRLQCVYAERPAGELVVRLSAPDEAALFQAILASARPA